MRLRWSEHKWTAETHRCLYLCYHVSLSCPANHLCWDFIIALRTSKGLVQLLHQSITRQWQELLLKHTTESKLTNDRVKSESKQKQQSEIRHHQEWDKWVEPKSEIVEKHLVTGLAYCSPGIYCIKSHKWWESVWRQTESLAIIGPGFMHTSHFLSSE